MQVACLTLQRELLLASGKRVLTLSRDMAFLSKPDEGWDEMKCGELLANNHGDIEAL